MLQNEKTRIKARAFIPNEYPGPDEQNLLPSRYFFLAGINRSIKKRQKLGIIQGSPSHLFTSTVTWLISS